MRILILCEVFPLVGSTRALQMARVVRALHEYGAGIHVISGTETGRISTARQSRRNSPHGLEYIPYLKPYGSTGVFARWMNRIGTGLSKTNRSLAKSIMRFPFIAEAARRAGAAVRDFRPDVLLTVAVPMDWHRVGLKMKKRFPDLPWAAFYSDPRPLSLLPKPYRRRAPGNYRKVLLNRRILCTADAVLAPNKYMLDWMEAKLGVSLADRKHVVPHCGLRATPAPYPEDARGWLLHVGRLDKTRISVDLLEAVKNVARKFPRVFKGLKCVGWVGRELRSLVKALDMEDLVRIVGTVSPESACSMIAAADVNLVSEAPMEVGCFLPSKFADCAVAGRPILAVTPEPSAVRDYLNTYGGGIPVTHDRPQIERALADLFLRGEPRSTSETDASGCGETRLAEPFLPECVAREYLDAFGKIARPAGRIRRKRTVASLQNP